MTTMTKKERIRAAVTGGTPDRLPYSFWSHLPEIDLDPVRLADETYAFYKQFDLDFIKTMNNGMYAIEDFGCTADYSEIATGGVARLVSTPVHAPDDWTKLTPCPTDKGSLARELLSLRLLLEKLKGEHVPVLFTIFTPLTIAEKIAGKALMDHIAAGHGDKVKQALEVITKTTADLAAEAIQIGADGVFLASQMANYDAMSPALYREYGVPYDLRVLEGAKNGWFNTIHAHGKNIMFDILREYPIAAFNWHVWETLPAPDEAFALSGKCLMGGLERMDITNRDRNAIQHQIYECLRLLGGRNHILTPGCVIRYPLDTEILACVKEIKDFVEGKMKK